MQPEHQATYKGFRIVAIVDRLPGSRAWQSEVLIFPLFDKGWHVKQFPIPNIFKTEREAVYSSFDFGQGIIDEQVSSSAVKEEKIARKNVLDGR